MSELVITQDDCSTKVYVKAGLRADIGAIIRGHVPAGGRTICALVTDRTVGGLYVQAIERSLVEAGLAVPILEIKPGEGSKSLTTAGQVYDFLAASGIGRDGLVLALGGGVVSDLAGFAAGTWMRGVRFAICPTTLEADVDAAIGGKTAVNTQAGKNLVGVFHPPIVVAVDPQCLATLPRRDLRSGLAESVKHAVLFSPEFVAWHESSVDEVIDLEPAALTELIERNIRIKGELVSRDPRERSGERMLLNFGHTIGHAIEACGDYELRHGECVGLGMIAACRLSRRVGVLDAAVVDRVVAILDQIGLPTRLENAPSADRILDAIDRDKKHHAGKARFVLLEAIGRPVIRDDVAPGVIREVYESLSA